MPRDVLRGLMVVGMLLAVETLQPPRACAMLEASPQRTITGVVVDPSAYLKDGSHGATQTDQTYQAVDSGQTLALLEEPAGNLYLLLAENPGDDPNALVYDYVNQQVKATGRVYAKGGVQGIVLTAVDPLEAPAEDN